MRRETIVTLYNCSTTADEGTVYNRTVMRVHLEASEGSREAKTRQDSLDSYVLFIPFYVEEEIDKSYVEPKKYETMKNKNRVFTLKKGDMVTLGETGEIGNLKKFLMEHDVLRIEKCSALGFGMPQMRHWEVHCN